MSDKARNYEQELAALVDGMAESVFEMSDEEVRAEMNDEGDPTESVRDILRQAVKACRQERLIEAQRRYEERVASFGSKRSSLPESVEEQRDLLNLLLASRPALGSAILTAQYRDFKDLPDEEVASYLRQLIDLGAMDDDAMGDEE